MTRKQLSDLCKLRLGVLGSDTRLDERTIWWLADMMRRKLLAEYVVKFGSDSRGHWMKTITSDIKTDSITTLKYCVADFIETPDGQELVSVSKLQDFLNPFIQQEVGQAAVYNGLEASEIGTTYWHETDRIYFNNLGGEVEKVAIICCPSIASLEDYDEIPMPASIENDVIEGVVAKIMNQVPTDKTADQRNSPE